MNEVQTTFESKMGLLCQYASLYAQAFFLEDTHTHIYTLTHKIVSLYMRTVSVLISRAFQDTLNSIKTTICTVRNGMFLMISKNPCQLKLYLYILENKL